MKQQNQTTQYRAGIFRYPGDILGKQNKYDFVNGSEETIKPDG